MKFDKKIKPFQWLQRFFYYATVKDPGLPTPNIFTGGFNYHGRYEAIVVEDMYKAVETVIEVIKSYAK